jgi:biotin carboxyl carrier protein
VTAVLEVGGTRRPVTARRSGRGWIVTGGGEEKYADLVRTGARWSLLIGAPPGPSGEGGGVSGALRSHEIAIEARGPGQRMLYVDGRPIAVSRPDPRAVFGRSGAAVVAAAGSGRIVSPMPGRIVKVLVKTGEAVTAGQGLLVVEAMKMENEVRAQRAGTVRELRVVEGASVEANTILVVVE